MSFAFHLFVQISTQKNPLHFVEVAEIVSYANYLKCMYRVCALKTAALRLK